MNIHPERTFTRLLIFFILVSLACNVPAVSSAGNSQSPANPPEQSPNPNLSSPESPGSPSPAGTTTAEAPASTVSPISHVLTPGNISSTGTVMYDVDSSGTASENRAPYGDSYNINLFERPFSQNTMVYIPALDIQTFGLNADDTWYYVSIQLSGGDMNDPLGIDYGVELDTNHDGIGDYLIWAKPPYSTNWSTDTVRVYSDPNHDVGGASPEKSDANATTAAPYPGDGYETIIFNQGQGNDPDLAWVRLDPTNAATVQFAFKQTLAGAKFMWGVWADAGLKDPSKFNYNDRFTLTQAGSPIKGSSDYPIKAIYQVDNTCWTVFGFKPTGLEPHLCPSNTPAATKAAKSPQASCTTSKPSTCTGVWLGPPTCACIPVIPIPVCLPAGTLIDTPSGQVPVENLKIGDPVWTTDAQGNRITSTILNTRRVSVPAGHPLVHVVLSDGRSLWVSPNHPTADGRLIGSLAVGDILDGTSIAGINSVASDQPATYDLLPAGATGDYWANGILIGSTLSTSK